MTKLRAFTVEEANDMIPVLDAVLDAIEDKAAAVRQHREKLQILETLWGEGVQDTGNPDYREYREHREATGALIGDIKAIVSTEITARGLRFPPGGVENGLIDFPSTYQGRWVFLCWKRGESQVSFWHEIDGGFAGRHEIAAEHIISMGKLDDPPNLDDSLDDSLLDL